MRGGTAFRITGTVGAEVGTLYSHNLKRFYGFANCFYNIYRRPADPHQSRPQASQLPPGEAFLRFYGFASCFYNILRSPADPHQSRPQGEPASPRGSFFSFLRIRHLFLQHFTLPR